MRRSERLLVLSVLFALALACVFVVGVSGVSAEVNETAVDGESNETNVDAVLLDFGTVEVTDYVVDWSNETVTVALTAARAERVSFTGVVSDRGSGRSHGDVPNSVRTVDRGESRVELSFGVTDDEMLLFVAVGDDIQYLSFTDESEYVPGDPGVADAPLAASIVFVMFAVSLPASIVLIGRFRGDVRDAV